VSIILARFQSGSKLSPRYLFCNTIYGTYDPALLPNFTGVLMKRGNRARISRLSSRATRPGCKLANYQHLKYGLPATNSLFSSTWILCLYKRKKAMGIGDRGSRIGGLEKATNRQTYALWPFFLAKTMHIVMHFEMGNGNPHLPAPKCTHNSFMEKIHTFILHFSPRPMYLYLFFWAPALMNRLHTQPKTGKNSIPGWKSYWLFNKRWEIRQRFIEESPFGYALW